MWVANLTLWVVVNMEQTRKDKKTCVVKSMGDRHSPPVRKNVLTKTYATPQTIIPVEIRNTVTFK
jgi:hypothetical protein